MTITTGMVIGKGHRARPVRCMSRVLVLAGICLPLGLAGCGSDTELNGKIFDLMGVSSAAQAASKSEPKMAVRSGLVLPPDASRLPEPGSGGTEEAVDLASLNDPDRKRALAAAERARLHKAYCSGEMNWKERVVDKNAAPQSPYGPCGLASGILNN